LFAILATRYDQESCTKVNILGVGIGQFNGTIQTKRTLEADLHPLSGGLNSSWRLAQNREQWRQLVEMAMFQPGARPRWWWWFKLSLDFTIHVFCQYSCMVRVLGCWPCLYPGRSIHWMSGASAASWIYTGLILLPMMRFILLALKTSPVRHHS